MVGVQRSVMRAAGASWDAPDTVGAPGQPGEGKYQAHPVSYLETRRKMGEVHEERYVCTSVEMEDALLWVELAGCWKIRHRNVARSIRATKEKIMQKSSGKRSKNSSAAKEPMDLQGVQQGRGEADKTRNGIADFISMTWDTLPWEGLWRELDEYRESKEQRIREENEAPDYGTVTMVRNGTRRLLLLYEEGEDECCMFVKRWEQAALPRRCDVNADLVIRTACHGEVKLECVIDRTRDQDVIVTEDEFNRTFVRVLDRKDFDNRDELGEDEPEGL